MCKKLAIKTDCTRSAEREVIEMTEQAAEARRAYKRKWAKEHRDKVKEHQERYWAKKAAQAAADQGGKDHGETD